VNMLRNKLGIVLLTLTLLSVSASAGTVAVGNICIIGSVLITIAGAIASIVIVSAGLKWVSSGDDPGARKQAKQMIIHAVVGLIIILLSNVLLTGAYFSCSF